MGSLLRTPPESKVPQEESEEMTMAKLTMSLPEAMKEALEKERTRRKLGTIQETIRCILAEYFKAQSRGARAN